uniref:Uncharacterized protein n=1 Tax=Kalanchoe fedtschenkoi TaxID=63787 RepID=A0A7N0ZTR2_KALFE
MALSAKCWDNSEAGLEESLSRGHFFSWVGLLTGPSLTSKPPRKKHLKWVSGYLELFKPIKKVLSRSLSGSRTSSSTDHISKGYFAVYVGDHQRRYVVPVDYLSQPALQQLLIQAEEEYGFDHPNGGLTIPCSKEAFNQLTFQLG